MERQNDKKLEGLPPQSGEKGSLPPPLHVALVIDCSKSMADKISEVKKALFKFLDRLEKGVRGGVVTFGEGGVQLQQGLTADLEYLKEIIASLGTGGSSWIGSAVSLADKELLWDEEALNVMVLLSDGWSAKEEETAIDAARKARARGVRMITMGLGGEVNGDFLGKIASYPTDSYLFADSLNFSHNLSRLAKGLRKTDYFPIPVSSLIVGRALDFGLFLKEKEVKTLPFMDRGAPFRPEEQRLLKEKGIDTLFCRGPERERYRRYLEECQELGLLDRKWIVQEKGKVIYESTTSLVEEIFEDPLKGSGVRKASDSVRHILDFIFSVSEDGKPFREGLASFLSHQYSLYTHSVNACIYGMALASFMGWEDSQELYGLGLGLLLHDIGKSPAGPAGTNQSGTGAKWRVARLHTTWGLQLLEENPEPIPDRVYLLIEQHHERMDRSGFPSRLGGVDIHPWARIAAVIDTYDNLTTEKEVGEAWSPFEALKIMGETMRGQLDPTVMKAFIQFLGSSKGISPSELKTKE